MISTAIQQLVNYGLDTGLILPDDEIYIRNQLLMTMQLDSFTEPESDVCYADLESILKTLVDDAAARGVCDDSPTARDLFDTRLMGVLTPRPSIVRANFEERYETDGPQAATDWFYKFSQDTDYIRRYRIKRDVKWVTKTPYGDLDITINLSKPEKDPKAIAAARDVGTFVCYAPRMTESAPFWPDEASLQETARAFFPQADVLLLKNSDLFPLFGSHELRTALFALFSGHVQLIFYSDSENIHLFTRSVLLSAAKNDLAEAELLHRLCRLNTWPDKLAGLRESTLRKLLF